MNITHTFFMLVKTTPAWLALPPKERFAFLRAKVEPLLRERPSVRMRYYDAEAFTARCTDVLVWETSDVAAYMAIVESLRETRFWDDYFLVLDVIPAVENAYATHYGEAPL